MDRPPRTNLVDEDRGGGTRELLVLGNPKVPRCTLEAIDDVVFEMPRVQGLRPRCAQILSQCKNQDFRTEPSSPLVDFRASNESRVFLSPCDDLSSKKTASLPEARLRKKAQFYFKSATISFAAGQREASVCRACGMRMRSSKRLG
ncbi:hypothetical protein KM043_000371 [Ampulex compressa]|nr:hypothetical protein KM043_000371 [Ampulex compressa]